VKFILLVEGHTERQAVARFLKDWLDPKLARPVRVEPVLHRGSGKLTSDMVRNAQKFLDAPRSGAEVIGAIGLMDLYGAPLSFFGQLGTVAEKYDAGKRYFEELVDRSRFRMHFAVHETEAWFFSEPLKLPRRIQPALPKRPRLPETIDFDEPPAKLLARLYGKYLGRKYNKPVDGANLLRKLDPNVAAEKCPYLKRLLDEMLALARDADL
jgi:Domain of unknown function (DUF4276)